MKLVCYPVHMLFCALLLAGQCRGAEAVKLSPEKVQEAQKKLLGKGGDVKVEGFSSFESAKNFDLAAVTRLVAEEDGFQKAAKAVAAHDPAAYFFVLANARRPLKELTEILGPAEKTATSEENFRIPEATEIAFQQKVSVTWHEYNWLAFGAVNGKIVAARVMPKKLIEAEKTK